MKFDRIYMTFLIACMLTARSNGSGRKIINSIKNTSENDSCRIDTIIARLKSKNTFIPIEDIRKLDIIDKAYSYASKCDSYCETTVQLTSDIFYSIISLPDTFGLCSYYFVLTVDEKKKKAIDSKSLGTACDIDFAVDTYEVYDHLLIAKDTLLLRTTKVYQKEIRTPNDEENIERKEIEEQRFHVESTGKITLIKSTGDK